MKTCKLFPALAFVVILVPAAWGEEPSDGQKQPLTAAQVRMAVQEICPVSGKKLGSHGNPIAVKIGEQHVFLCCQGCTSGKVDREHWTTIHSNFAKAQGICPVMKHELPQNAKWTIVQGQVVYVCCPPCIQKIEAAPDAYLKTIDELYRTSLEQP